MGLQPESTSSSKLRRLLWRVESGFNELLYRAKEKGLINDHNTNDVVFESLRADVQILNPYAKTCRQLNLYQNQPNFADLETFSWEYDPTTSEKDVISPVLVMHACGLGFRVPKFAIEASQNQLLASAKDFLGGRKWHQAALCYLIWRNLVVMGDVDFEPPQNVTNLNIKRLGMQWAELLIENLKGVASSERSTLMRLMGLSSDQKNYLKRRLAK